MEKKREKYKDREMGEKERWDTASTETKFPDCSTKTNAPEELSRGDAGDAGRVHAHGLADQAAVLVGGVLDPAL